MTKEIHYHRHMHLEADNVQGTALIQGDGNTVNQRVENSFNNPELDALMAQLTEAVNAMAAHLPPAQAEEAQDDLKRLQEELQKEKPRRKWYSVSIEGLKAAARNVGEIGAPVIMLADKILHLLG